MVLYYLTVALFGLTIGSFFNVLILRLYEGKSLGGRSACPRCGRQIAWYDNIPVLSFLVLSGKCRQCRAGISVQYPIVESVTALLFVLALYVNLNQESGIMNQAGAGPLFIIHDSLFILRLARDWIFLSAILILFVFDYRWMILPDIVTLPAAVLVLGLNLATGADWKNLVISGIIGAGFFGLQYLVSRGRWIGGGDIRLGAILGFFFGWPMIIPAILIAYFIGAGVSLPLLALKKRGLKSELPLGVFLAMSALIVYIYGEPILGWYLRQLSW